MAKSRLGALTLTPPWPRHLSPAAAPALQAGAVTIDEVGDRIILLGHAVWSDGASHDLRTLHWRSSSASSPVLTLRVGPRDPDLAAGPPGRDDGTTDQSATHVNPAANTNFSSTLDADRTVAHGEFLGLVWTPSAYTSGSVQLSTLSAASITSPGRPVQTLFDDPTYGAPGANAIYHVTLEASDGTFGYILGTLPRISAAINTEAYNNATASGGDERGAALTVAEPRWLSSVAFLMQAASGADFDVTVYEDDALMASGSVTVDANTLNAAASVRWIEVLFPDLAFTPGHTYDVHVKPTTANNVTIYTLDVTAAGHLGPFAGTMHYSQRTDGGSATRTTTRLPFVQLGFSAFDDGASAGGGLLTHPGMSGGLNA